MILPLGQPYKKLELFRPFWLVALAGLLIFTVWFAAGPTAFAQYTDEDGHDTQKHDGQREKPQDGEDRQQELQD